MAHDVLAVTADLRIRYREKITINTPIEGLLSSLDAPTQVLSIPLRKLKNLEVVAKKSFVSWVASTSFRRLIVECKKPLLAFACVIPSKWSSATAQAQKPSVA